MSDTRRALIAVFGGNKVGKRVRALAEDIGAAIAEQGHILLTGGDKPRENPGDKSKKVKERAIEGVGGGPWIGVPQTEDLGWYRLGHGFVIRSGLGDKRNYLEACLCDAAVALEGGWGTLSEVIFSLSLGKPVALVGRRHWRKALSLDDSDRPQSLASWAEAIAWVREEDPRGTGELDRLLSPETIGARLQHPPPAYLLLSSKSPAPDILGSLLPSLRLSAREPGSVFPVDGYAEVETGLLNWIDELGPRQVSPAPVSSAISPASLEPR